ncbi:MAG: YbjN domain-containing protein [Phascolarctobacterium sp.]|jgi:hypothetical protein
MLTISDFKTLLDNNKLNYQKLNETTIIISNGCEKYNFSYNIAVDINNGFAKLFFMTGIKFQEVNINIYQLINGLNDNYRFFKFTVDDDKELIMQVDAIVKENNSTDEIMELLLRGSNVLEEIYPNVQKEIWR